MNIAEALLAVTQLIGVAQSVLTSLSNASAVIAKAHQEGRTTLTDGEMAVLYNADAAARYDLIQAINARTAVPVPTPAAQLQGANLQAVLDAQRAALVNPPNLYPPGFAFAGMPQEAWPVTDGATGATGQAEGATGATGPAASPS